MNSVRLNTEMCECHALILNNTLNYFYNKVYKKLLLVQVILNMPTISVGNVSSHLLSVSIHLYLRDTSQHQISFQL